MKKFCVIGIIFLLTFNCESNKNSDTFEKLDGVWGDYGIIDIHAHIGYFKGYDLSVNTLMDNINDYGVSTALISNVDGSALQGVTLDLSEKTVNEATADTVKQFPERLKGILWTKPTNGSPEVIESFLSDEAYKGMFVALKIHPEFNRFPADSSIVEPYLELCRKYGIPAVFHSGSAGANSDPQKIYAIAKQFPDVKIVLYHTGFLGPHDQAIGTVKQSIENGDADLYVGTGQVSVEGVLASIKELGIERVLFGTDATYYGKEHYKKYEPMIAMLKAELSEEDFYKILRGNAKKVFNIQ